MRNDWTELRRGLELLHERKAGWEWQIYIDSVQIILTIEMTAKDEKHTLMSR